MHDLSLITTIAAAFTAAWLLGLLTQWMRLSPIVGYLLAGVIIGPHTPGFVGNVHIAQQLAEVGVILLMFGVGLHFHLKDLIAVKGVAVPGAVGQSLVATLLAVAVFSAFGLPLKAGVVIGMAMAVASTVVLMRVLMDADVLNTPQGHAAVGWLIVEDIFTVILLVLIPVLGDPEAASAAHAAAGAAAGQAMEAVAGYGAGGAAEKGGFWTTLALALGKLAVLVGVVLVAGARVVPWVLVRVARLRSRELFTLTVLVFSVAIAAGSYFFFGASMALGAFLAGMVVAQSPVSHQAAADALPMRDAFAVIFFVSVGMLFDPSFLVREPLMVVAALGIILLAKPLAALVIVALLGYSARTALTVAVGLAQIGEFSFILSDLAKQHGLMPETGHHVLVAAAIISITVNPLLFRALPRMENWLRARPRLWQLINARAERRAAAVNRPVAEVLDGETGAAAAGAAAGGFAIVVGYGPVGRSVHRVLLDAGLGTVVIDLNMDTVAALNAGGHRAIFGDASNGTILEQAGVKRATHLVLTVPDPSHRAAVVTAGRSLNGAMRILVRARYLQERAELERGGASVAVFEEAEAAVALARLVLADTGQHRENAERKIRDLRLQLIMDNMSNIRVQRVGSVMVPWARVRWLPSDADVASVLSLAAQERFSRWPVVDRRTGQAEGYLLTKDLLAQAPGGDWRAVVRPLRTIAADESIDAVLTRMQEENASLYLVVEPAGGASAGQAAAGEEKDAAVRPAAVEAPGRPVGLVTQEDILEQVVGKLEDEYPHDVPVSLAEAVSRGVLVLRLEAASPEKAVREMVAAIPPQRLPGSCGAGDIAELVLAREAEISTDLGNGVAIPHARCPDLRAPVVLVGRSEEGILFPPGGQEPVHLVFLLITPASQPEAQLALLSQIARIAAVQENRDALRQADSPAEFMDRLHRFVLKAAARPARGSGGGGSGSRQR